MTEELKIRVEESFLIGLCRLGFNNENIAGIKALAEGEMDWNYFTTLTNSHGIAALAYHNLEKLEFLKYLPGENAMFLRGALMKSLSRNAYNTEAIGEVLSLLNREKIKTVLLKGLALELSVYGNAGLRQMNDIDILISRGQCMQAREILISNGFVSLPVKSFFHKLIIANTGKHLPSLLKEGTSVEIHHELFSGRRNSLTTMLHENSYNITIKGERAHIPQPQIFFLYLIRHLSLHEMNNESQLRLYTDLVILLEKHYDIIINYDLLSYASEAGMAETLASHLEPLRDLWGISFPEWINNYIDRFHTSDSINRFIFFLKSPKDNPGLNKHLFYRRTVSEIPGLHRKCLFLLGDIFPAISFMKKRYNCKSTWRVLFYYPHRLGKVLWLFKK